MNINFKDICGNSFVIQFSLESTISDACQILSQKLETQGYQIFIISPNEGQNFYPNNYSMINVLKENPEYVMFTRCFKLIKDEEYQIEKDTKSNLRYNYFKRRNERYFYNPSLNSNNHTIFRAKNLFRIYYNMHFYRPNQANNYLYQQYSQALNNIPLDFEERVKKIAEFGFLIEDIKESLRLSNYDIQKATNMIISQNFHENDQKRFKSHNTNSTINYNITYNNFSHFHNSKFQNQKLNASQKVDENPTFSLKQPQQKNQQERPKFDHSTWGFGKTSQNIQNKDDQNQFKFTFQRTQKDEKISEVSQNQKCQNCQTSFKFNQNAKWQFSSKPSVFQQKQKWSLINPPENKQHWSDK